MIKKFFKLCRGLTDLTGAIPYPAMSNMEVFEAVQKGYRMKIPENFPPVIKQIVELCWQENPDHRPNFHELFGMIDNSVNARPAAPPRPTASPPPTGRLLPSPAVPGRPATLPDQG
jgi:hypothetical protein